MTQLNQYAEQVIDGRAVKIPVSQPPLHNNPPLQSLNTADKAATAERRTEVDEVVQAGIGAMRGHASSKMGRRTQKMLRPVSR